MRMTPRKKQNAPQKLAKPVKSKSGWGSEPVEFDDEEDSGPLPEVLAQRVDDLASDKATLQKVEAELAEKRKALAAEQAKLTPLEQEAQKLRNAIRRGHAEVVADNIDALLLVVPEHGRTSCSDADPSNDGRGCSRCALLHIKENRWDAASFEIEVHVTRMEH